MPYRILTSRPLTTPESGYFAAVAAAVDELVAERGEALVADGYALIDSGCHALGAFSLQDLRLRRGDRHAGTCAFLLKDDGTAILEASGVESLTLPLAELQPDQLRQWVTDWLDRSLVQQAQLEGA